MMLSGLVDKYRRFGESSYIMCVETISDQGPPHTRNFGLVRRPPLLCVIYKYRRASRNTTWWAAISYTYFQLSAHCCNDGGTTFLRITGTYTISPTCITSHSERQVMRNSSLFHCIYLLRNIKSLHAHTVHYDQLTGS